MPETTEKPWRVKKGSSPETPFTIARSPGDREAIEADGGTVATLGEALGLADHDMKVIDLKIGLADAIARLRGEAKLTQAALAKRLGVSRPRIAEIEAKKPSVSLDSLFPAFWAVGGTTAELLAIVRRTDDSASY